MSTTTDTLDTVRRATEARDGASLADLYADGATITIVDRSRPPSRPEVIAGTEAIRRHLVDAAATEMTHEVRDEVRGEDRIAFTVRCRYPDGTRVVCATVADLDTSGRITAQTIVQAWDE